MDGETEFPPASHELKEEIFYDEEYHWQECVEDDIVNAQEHDLIMQNDETSHWQICECGYTSEKANHTYGKWNVLKEATEESKGLQERTCSVCEYKETQEIPVKEKGATPTPGGKQDGKKDAKKTDPTKKADLVASNSKESLKSASTGDDTNVVFWVTLLIIGVGAATIVFRTLYTIKKNRK